MTIAKPPMAWDLCVIGAGIFGLSVAWAARGRGLSVLLLDARTPGAGASGGIVGALSPHVPDQWNPKKQFQLDALTIAAAHWAEVEAVSGLASGYARRGRLMPLTTQDAAARAHLRQADARQNWGDLATWSVVPRDALPPHIAPVATPFGAAHETLSAAIRPRAACLSLAEALRRRGGEIRSNTPVTALAPGRVETPDQTITAGRIVVAAGVEGFGLLAPLLGQTAGSGVKGQAALLAATLPDETPLIFHDGLYIVPHGKHGTAVGSTSENRYTDPTQTDAQLEAVIARARALSPALADAPVGQRWAGVRPKARRRDPMLGPLPDTPEIIVANGAFKIGFGIAHKVGAVIAQMLVGETPDLPESFTVAHHLEPVHA